MKIKSFLKYIAVLCVFYGNSDTDKYRLIINQDPSSTITIAWNQKSGTNPVVRYGQVDQGTNEAAYTNSKTNDRVTSYKGMENHFARLTGLSANTNYYFVIKDSQGVSERFWFRTAPSDNSRLSFIVGGDSRNNNDARRWANTLVPKLKPHAVFFSGDMTQKGSDAEWQKWFDDWQLTTDGDGRMFPIISARGNHEGPTQIYNLFDTPTTDSYYAVTFGNNLVRAYTLNSEISVAGNQTSWLQNDLNSHGNMIWKMAQYHKPMRPHSSGKEENDSQYDAWAQLFYNKDVRLVVDCDSHVAKTTWPIKPSTGSGSDEGFIRDDAKGTVYTGEGCWGAPLRPYDDTKSWTRNGGSFNQFKLVFIDANKIELRTILVNDNASSVNEVSNNDPFTLPSNLETFKPSTGEVVIITNNKVDCEDEGTACDDGNPNTINDEEDGNCNCIGNNTCPDAGTACDDDDSQTTNDVEDGNCNCSGVSEAATVNYEVEAGDDDAEEGNSNGHINLGSSDLELVYDADDDHGDQFVGIRFNNIQIPKSATISEAYIQFTVKEPNSGEAVLRIKGENIANSNVFKTDAFNITDRPTTNQSVRWTITQPWANIGDETADQKTPNLKGIVQEIVDLPEWTPSNSMSFIIKGTGERTAHSYNGSSSKAPKLSITYSSGSLSTSTVEKISINIYPNPASKLVNIKSNKDIDNVSLYSILGHKVLSFYPNQSDTTLDISQYKSGIYFIHIKQNNNQIKIYKLIIL